MGGALLPSLFSNSISKVSKMQNTINLGGKERPVNYGTLFLYNYQAKHGISPLGKINEILANLPTNVSEDADVDTSILGMLDFPYMINLLIVAMESGQEARGEAVSEYSTVEVCGWVDEAGGMEFLLMIMMGVFAALPKGKAAQNGKAVAPAKKKK